MHELMGWLVCHSAAVDEASRQPSAASFLILNAAPINVALVDRVSHEHMVVVSKPQNAVRMLEQLNRKRCEWNECRQLFGYLWRNEMGFIQFALYETG